MIALDSMRGSTSAPPERTFLSARNVLMMQVLLTNGQRTGAVRNLTCSEVKQMREVDGCFVINVKDHKTKNKFVCQLVVDDDLRAGIETFSLGRKLFLQQRDAQISQDQQKPFFCDCRGEKLFSNELARIARAGVGGTVTDMRKAQYHLVSW